MMQPREVLAALRDGIAVDGDALRDFATGLGDGTVSQAQAGAFAMAVCLNGMSEQGRIALTEGMRDSGQVLKWDLPGPVLDKHSTGGVGDAVSLLLAPMLAAVGVFVPMISGRGLGHTGGTLDKLEAIPGVRTEIREDKFRRIVQDVGCAIVAPTGNIAPADKLLYGVRDVTGTVRSIDLITSSILSKKLAAGLDGLVLDVKFGTGAVMEDIDDATRLATALVKTANGAGCKTSALITDMNQPLLPSIGNAVEVADVMREFAGANGRLTDAALALGAELLVTCGFVETAVDGTEQLTKTLKSGAAQECFGRMIKAQGGPANFAERWEDYLSIAPAYDVPSPHEGYVTFINAAPLGQLVVALGGGRQVETDKIDHGVGLSDIARIGAAVKEGEPLARIHCRSDEQFELAKTLIHKAVVMSDRKPKKMPLVADRIGL